jgi:Zn-dependent M28 family amino/carboxypeptidase
MRTTRLFVSLTIVVLLLLGAAPENSRFSRALASVSAGRISARIRFLADDLLEGRGTGARGSEIAARYIAADFAGDSLLPAGDSGTYLQNFEMLGVSTEPSSSVVLETPKGPIELKNGENSVLSTRGQKPAAAIDAPVVFVGYGITAPEMQWDDYRDFDARGKLLIALVNDPPSDNPAFFGGKALTYYGRWTYKYEEAARHHAAGILLVHTDATAGYGWQVVRNSWSGEQAQLPLASGEEDLPLDGWITRETASRLFAGNGLDLEVLMSSAGSRGFRPVPLDKTHARGSLAFQIRRYRTENVAGVLPGSDPALRKTSIALTAHFDHLGIGRPDSRGDTIYNGAVDNASGVSLLLEIARAAADAGWRPKRSILFLGVTAEEQGLLGSSYAARHLPAEAGRVVANFNMDGTSVNGETTDFLLLGAEKTTLEPVGARVAAAMGARIDPDAHPEQGQYFRSDHFNFAKVGIPAVSVKPGWMFRGHDAAYGERVFHDYQDHRYHQPSDEFDPAWDLSGTVQEARFLLRLIEAVGSDPKAPRFKAGQELTGAVAESK